MKVNTGQFQKIPLEIRFFEHVEKQDNSCWVWIAGVDKNGYGRSSINRKVIQAHRVSWIMHHGAIPKNMQVLHKCDNPPCVNPGHLFLGTNKDNMLDKMYKNRHTKGEAVNTNKLKQEDVLVIKAAIRRGESPLSIAKAFRITRATIYDIKNDRSWSWLS